MQLLSDVNARQLTSSSMCRRRRAKRAGTACPISYVDISIVPGVTTIKKDHVLQLRTGTQ